MPLITGMMSTPKSAANEKHVKTIEKSFLVLEQARKNRKKSHGFVSRCYEQTLWVFADRLPPADTRKHALENEHFARRETNRVPETYLNGVRGRKRSFVKMSKRMKGSLPYLQVLVESKPQLRKILIDNAPESVITAICLNLLKGVIPLTSPQKRRLARHKTHLRALANKKVSRKKKKQYLNQKGGNLLTALIPPVWEF